MRVRTMRVVEYDDETLGEYEAEAHDSILFAEVEATGAVALERHGGEQVVVDDAVIVDTVAAGGHFTMTARRPAGALGSAMDNITDVLPSSDGGVVVTREGCRWAGSEGDMTAETIEFVDHGGSRGYVGDAYIKRVSELTGDPGT